MDLGRYRLSPEIRYTHWAKDVAPANASAAFQALTNPNQAEALLSFTF